MKSQAAATRRYITSDRFWPWWISLFGVITVIAAAFDRAIYWIFLGILIIPPLLWCVFLASDYLRIRKWRKGSSAPAVYLSVNHEWQFEYNGDFAGTGIYELKNTSDEPLLTLPRDDFLWAVNPETARIRVRVLDDGGKLHAITEYDNTIYRRALSALSNRDRTSFVISLSHTVAPPLLPDEVTRFELLMETPGTESDAFTPEGTVLGIPANIPTLKAHLVCVAPAGFRFEIIKSRWVVESSTGANVPTEEARIDGPVLSPAETTLTWDLADLKAGLRYWVRYRFSEKAVPETPLERLAREPGWDEANR